MTNMNLLQAMGHIDPKLISDSAPDESRIKIKNKTWMKWASLTACLALVCISAIISGSASFYNAAMGMVVINYGMFILVPLLFVSIINLYFLFTKRSTKDTVIVNVISLFVINILNVLGLYLYSSLGRSNLVGVLPNILIGFNAGAVFFIITHTLIDKKVKDLRAKMLLWTLVSVISILLACMAHNIIFTLFQSYMITFA